MQQPPELPVRAHINMAITFLNMIAFPSELVLREFGSFGERHAMPLRVIGGGLCMLLFFAYRSEPPEAVWGLRGYILLLIVHRVAGVFRSHG